MLRRYFYIILAAILLILQGIQNLFRAHLEWDNVYLAAAKALAHHQDIYSVTLYTYPPFPVFLLIPLVFVPLWLGRLAFCGAISFSFVYYIQKAWRISGGGDPRGPVPLPFSEHLIFLLGLACGLDFALNSLSHMQTDLIIAALLMCGVGEIVGGRYIRSAVWIGLAAAFKATPLLFAPYLLWRRQWIAAGLLVAVFVGVNLLPDLVHAPDGGGVWLTRWIGRYVQPLTRPNYDPGDWMNNPLNYNHGLAGTLRRWFTTRLGDASNKFMAVARPDRWNVERLRQIFLAAAILVILPVAYVFWRKRTDPSPQVRLIECGIVMLLMLIFSPSSSKTHFCIMILPGLCAARAAYERRDGAIAFLTIASAICALLVVNTSWPSFLHLQQLLLWIGIVLFSALFLLAASLRTLAQS